MKNSKQRHKAAEFSCSCCMIYISISYFYFYIFAFFSFVFSRLPSLFFASSLLLLRAVSLFTNGKHKWIDEISERQRGTTERMSEWASESEAGTVRVKVRLNVGISFISFFVQHFESETATDWGWCANEIWKESIRETRYEWSHEHKCNQRKKNYFFPTVL